MRDLLLTGPDGVKAELEVLLAGGTIDKPIDENIVLRDIAAAHEVEDEGEGVAAVAGP